MTSDKSVLNGTSWVTEDIVDLLTRTIQAVIDFKIGVHWKARQFIDSDKREIIIKYRNVEKDEEGEKNKGYLRNANPIYCFAEFQGEKAILLIPAYRFYNKEDPMTAILVGTEIAEKGFGESENLYDDFIRAVVYGITGSRYFLSSTEELNVKAMISSKGRRNVRYHLRKKKSDDALHIQIKVLEEKIIATNRKIRRQQESLDHWVNKCNKVRSSIEKSKLNMDRYKSRLQKINNKVTKEG